MCNVCPKCQRNFFKWLDEVTQCCAHCGTVLMIPIDVVATPDHTRCKNAVIPGRKKGSGFARKPDSPGNKWRVDLNAKYMETVYEFIKNELWRLTSWHQIGKLLEDRTACLCIKSLRKYYRLEMERRGDDKCQVE